eukprot:scaffold111572_cov53-Phaeocystis_antarctica.AAC.1
MRVPDSVGEPGTVKPQKLQENDCGAFTGSAIGHRNRIVGVDHAAVLRRRARRRSEIYRVETAVALELGALGNQGVHEARGGSCGVCLKCWGCVAAGRSGARFSLARQECSCRERLVLLDLRYENVGVEEGVVGSIDVSVVVV